MAFRSVLAKLGNNCVRSDRRSVANMLGAFETRTLNNYPNIRDDEYEDLMQDRIWKRRESLGLHRSCCGFVGSYPHREAMDNPDIMAYARFAVVEFNKQKNAQLQFVRVVKAGSQESSFSGQIYYLTLEAVDADVVKMYQAIVNDSPDPSLELFGLVADNGNGSLLKLIVKSRFNHKFIGLDCRENPVPREKSRYSLKKEIEVPLKKREGYFLDDEILGSMRLLSC